MRTGFIRLTDEDVSFARKVAGRRHNEAIDQGREDKHGLKARGRGEMQEHDLGALGELAVARLWGVEWPAHINTFKSIPDLAEWEIRTRSRLYYELLIRPDDPDDRPFVLVHLVSYPHAFNVTGWMTAGDAKQKEWKKEHGGRPPAYFPPNSELRDFDPYDASHAIGQAISDAYILSYEERKDLDDEERERDEHEKFAISLRVQEEDDARRWKEFIDKHGPLLARTKVEYFSEGHPYAGFSKTTHTTPDPLRAQKCIEEAEEFCRKRDAWIEQFVGPIHPKRRKWRSQRQKAALMDQEAQLSGKRKSR